MRKSNLCNICRALFYAMLGVLTVPGVQVAAQEEIRREPAWQFTLGAGESVPSTVTIVNRCRQLHRFHIETDRVPYVQIVLPPEGVVVAPGAHRQVPILFDAAGKPPDVYRGNLIVVCSDCTRERGCTQDRDLFGIEMTVRGSDDDRSRQTYDDPQIDEDLPEADAQAEEFRDAALEAESEDGFEDDVSIAPLMRASSAGCRQECRQQDRDCRRECRAAEKRCLESCASSKGREKRRCRRACRRAARSCKQTCRGNEKECRQACEDSKDQSHAECSNGGFESGTFDGWAGENGTHRRPGRKKGLVPGRHTIVTRTSECSGFDCNLGGQILPVVPTSGGNYAAKLGNNGVTREGQRLLYTFRVTETNKIFRFQSAVVLQDPNQEHTNLRPYFRYRVKNARFPWNTLVKGQRVEAFSNPYFDGSANGIFYRNWSCEAIDLSAHVDKLVTVEFTTAACGYYAGHFGYAYIDSLCAPPEAVGAKASLALPHQVCQSGEIHADGSASVGEADHFWSIEESDANWERNPETEVMEWFLASEAGPMDLKAFYVRHGMQFQCNKYYRVKLAVRSGCTAWNEDVKLLYVSCPMVDAGRDRYICPDTPMPQILGSGSNGPGLSYSWSPEVYLDDPASPRPAATFEPCGRFSPNSLDVQHTVTAEDAEHCRASDSVVTTILCPARAKIEIGTAECCGKGRRLTATLAGAHPGTAYQYAWSPDGQTTPSIVVNPSQPMTYTVTVSDPCFSTTDRVTVEPSPPTLTGRFPELAAPNAFSPNGDGTNDVFIIHHLGLNAGEMPAYNATNWRFIVFDQWGSEIVVLRGDRSCQIANSSLPQWDGRANRSTNYAWWMLRRNTRAGEPLRQGVYPWQIYFENCLSDGGHTGWKLHRLGHVLLIR